MQVSQNDNNGEEYNIYRTIYILLEHTKPPKPKEAKEHDVKEKMRNDVYIQAKEEVTRFMKERNLTVIDVDYKGTTMYVCLVKRVKKPSTSYNIKEIVALYLRFTTTPNLLVGTPHEVAARFGEFATKYKEKDIGPETVSLQIKKTKPKPNPDEIISKMFDLK